MPSKPDSKAFAGKFLEKLEKISHEEIESFLSRLLREKRFFEAVLDHLLEGVVVTDPDGRIAYVNNAARRILSLRRQRSLIGDALVDHIPDADLRALFLRYNPDSDGIRDEEVLIGTPTERIYGVGLIPVREESGSLMGIVTLVQDRTERRRQEERRIQSQRLEALATLTAGVAHEIKNPLNSMSLHAHLLRKSLTRMTSGGEDENPERAARSADILIEEINRLTRVVDDFLLAARPTRPHFEMKNVNDILRRLAEMMEAEVAQRRINVDMELDSDIPPARIDAFQLTLAFRNILKNSIEAVEGEDGRIQVRTSVGEDGVIVEFRDNGSGIPEDQIGRIFEPYVTTKFHGTGLGLMTVYRIITEHGGRIEARNEPGQGAVIRIALPPGPQLRQLLPERTNGGASRDEEE